MLSILIPIYNHPVVELIAELKRQCDEALVPYEIIAVEDGSHDYIKENSEIRSLGDVQYVVHEHNLGRAAIRNNLAEMARFETLVFIDCDSLIVSSDYVRNYLSAIKRSEVVYGGTHYSETKDSAHALHLAYGKAREARNLEARLSNPYTSFLTNNFCIRKGVFDAIKFDESLTQYGFEDSLFGWELKQRGVAIAHIENPVLHTGLDTADAFIQKTKLAVENAWALINSGKIPVSEIRMAEVYIRLQKWGLSGLACKTIGVFEYQMLSNLKSITPNLIYLDLLKLKWSAAARQAN